MAPVCIPPTPWLAAIAQNWNPTVCQRASTPLEAAKRSVCLHSALPQADGKNPSGPLMKPGGPSRCRLSKSDDLEVPRLQGPRPFRNTTWIPATSRLGGFYFPGLTRCSRTRRAAVWWRIFKKGGISDDSELSRHGGRKQEG